jgi:hypothetical protein
VVPRWRKTYECVLHHRVKAGDGCAAVDVIGQKEAATAGKLLRDRNGSTGRGEVTVTEIWFFMQS